MMYYRFSKLSKTVIIVNVIVTIVLMIFYGILFKRSLDSYALIESYMDQHNLIMEKAIEELILQGEKLYIGILVFSASGIVISCGALVMLITYARTNSFISGFMAAFFSVFTSFIGGILLFYAFFSRRREIKGDYSNYTGVTEWDRFIHQRVLEDERKNGKV